MKKAEAKYMGPLEYYLYFLEGVAKLKGQWGPDRAKVEYYFRLFSA